MENKKLKIAVHNGNFHTDDIFAVAVLTLIYPKSKIIRTRDENKLKTANLRVDVGRKYNPKTGDFDHHQKELVKTRDNKIPYASAGLIWESFGKNLVNSKEAFDYIDKKIMQPIDADDNGINLCEKEIIPYDIQQIIMTFSPNWKTKNPNYDKAFLKAVDFAKGLLKKEIETANKLKKEREIIEKLAKKTSKEYLVFENTPPNLHNILLNHPDLKYIIYKNTNGNWKSEACRIKESSFKTRKPFPREWADLTNERLAKITKVNDAIFCHKGLFMVIAKSKKGVIKLTELALKN